MAARRIPIKKDFNSHQEAYVFLGDAHVAIHITFIYNDTPYWRTESEVEFIVSGAHKPRYAPYSGYQNVIYFPGSKRCHPLLKWENLALAPGSITINIEALIDVSVPEIPTDFKTLTPLELCKLMRVPPPKELHIDWKMEYLNTTSTLSVSLNMEETGIPVDQGARNYSGNALDDFMALWS